MPHKPSTKFGKVKINVFLQKSNHLYNVVLIARQKHVMDAFAGRHIVNSIYRNNAKKKIGHNLVANVLHKKRVRGILMHLDMTQLPNNGMQECGWFNKNNGLNVQINAIILFLVVRTIQLKYGI